MKNDKNVILIQSPMDRPGLQVDVNETPLFEPRIPSVATFSALQERSSSTMMEETQPNFQSSTATPSVVLTRSEVNETLDRIKSNQEYQAVLQEALKTLNKALERNRQLQVRFCLPNRTYGTLIWLVAYMCQRSTFSPLQVLTFNSFGGV